MFMTSIFRSVLFLVAACLMAIPASRADVNTSLSLLRALESDPNPAYAPTALFDMMGLLYYGAAGTSEQQLAALFGGAKREEVAAAAAKAQRTLPGYTSIGSVWFSERVQVTPEYFQAISNQWKFHVSAAPLRVAPDKAAEDINFWYSQQTKGYFADVINAAQLEDQPDMLAVIATAFISSWKTPFDPAKSRNATFYRSSEEQFPVKMVRATAKFPYFADETYQAVSIPLAMEDFQILYFLPRDARQFKEALNALNADYLEKVRKGLKSQMVDLELPRVSFKVERNWRNVFMKSKLTAPFTEGQANFSRINENKPEKLFISKLIEETAISWNEAGVEAKSVTKAALNEPFGKSEPEAREEFNANHPFIFIIYNKKAENIAFAGIISSKSQMSEMGQ